jgi:hypothetical protein
LSCASRHGALVERDPPADQVSERERAVRAAGVARPQRVDGQLVKTRPLDELEEAFDKPADGGVRTVIAFE